MKKILLYAAIMLLVMPALLSSHEVSAQTVSIKNGSEEKKEKKEEPKEKIVEKEVVKSETSLGGSRIENLGKYFLDKYTGQVSLVTYHKGEPVRWNILRDNTPEDWIWDHDTVNYQLIRYADGTDNILLININSGAMWAIDTKGFSYKNTRLKYIPAVDAGW